MVGGIGLGGLKLDWRLCGCLVNVIDSDRSDYHCCKWIRARVSHLVPTAVPCHHHDRPAKRTDARCTQSAHAPRGTSNSPVLSMPAGCPSCNSDQHADVGDYILGLAADLCSQLWLAASREAELVISARICTVAARYAPLSRRAPETLATPLSAESAGSIYPHGARPCNL